MLSRDTYRIGAGIELIHEALIPGVHTILEYLLDGIQQTPNATALSRRQREGHLLGKVLGLPVVDEGILDNAIGVRKQLTDSPGWHSLIGRPDEGDDQGFDGIEELKKKGGELAITLCNLGDQRAFFH